MFRLKQVSLATFFILVALVPLALFCYILLIHHEWFNCFTFVIFVVIAVWTFNFFSKFLQVCKDPCFYLGHSKPKNLVDLNPCQKSYNCDVCGYQLILGNHKFENTRKETDSLCLADKKCKVCGLEVALGIQHDFPSKPDLCEFDLVCMKCGYTEHISDNHDLNGVDGYRVCSRCSYYE